MRNIIFLNIISLVVVLFWFFVHPASKDNNQPFIGYNESIFKAEDAEKNKKYQEAINLYKIELQKNPNNAQLWIRVSDLESYSGNYEEAAEALEQAAKIEPKNTKIYIKLSEIYSMEKNPEQSLEALDRALELDPNNIDYLKRKITLGNWLDDQTVVQDAYQKILKIDPNNQEALLGLEKVQEVLLQQQTYNNIPKLGLEAEQRRDWHLAIYIYTRAIADDPQNANNLDLWLRIYNIQNSLKEYAEAVSSIEEAIKLDPNNISLYEKLAESYGVLGDSPKALDAINKALEINPKNAELLAKKNAITLLIAKAQSTIPSSIPALGLLYEGQKKWREAIKVYKEEIAKNPRDKKNYDILLRISDIENFLKNYTESARALQEAVRLKPREMSVYLKLSEIYNILKKTRESLAVIEQALKYFPENIELLKNRATLANILEDINRVKDSYCRILAQDPYNKDALLGIANLKIKQNYLDAAVGDYRKILTLYPRSATAWLDYARLESWRGNFTNAFAGLENYRQYFGCTKEYYAVKARLLAMVAYPKMSLCIVKYLESVEPTSYDFLYTRTLALNANNEISKALMSLNELKSLYPDKKDNKDLSEVVITPIRSNLVVDDFRSHDSDSIDIRIIKLSGQYFLTPETSVLFDVKHETLHEPKMNNLQTLDNHPYIWDNAQRIGLTHRFSPEVQLEGRGGTMQIQERDTYFIYNLTANLKTTDRTNIKLQIGKELYSVSPKAVSYAIRQTYNKIDMLWEPFSRIYIAAQGEYDTYSDGNRSGMSRIAPRVGIIRRQYINVDMGMMMDWLHFASTPVPYHGYWTPDLHRTVQMTTFAYYKDSHNIGYLVSTGYGVHKDETMAKYAFAGDFSAQAIFGVFCDWQLILSTAASIRINSSMFNTVGTNYRKYNFNVILTRRF